VGKFKKQETCIGRSKFLRKPASFGVRKDKVSMPSRSVSSLETEILKLENRINRLSQLSNLLTNHFLKHFLGSSSLLLLTPKSTQWYFWSIPTSKLILITSTNSVLIQGDFGSHNKLEPSKILLVQYKFIHL